MKNKAIILSVIAILFTVFLSHALQIGEKIFRIPESKVHSIIIPNHNKSTYYEAKKFKHHDLRFNLFAIPENKQFGIRYFSQNAGSRFEPWRQDKKVFIACAGAFSSTWEADSKPVGFTVDQGETINLNFDHEMDGLVIVENNSISVIDLDYLQAGIDLEDGQKISMNPRSSSFDCENLKRIAKEEKSTIFQTQLLYSIDRSSNFSNPYFGKIRERRFLAVCKKKNEFINVIVDAPDPAYLNLSAKYAKEVLEYDGYKIFYVLNLDTGDKNIFWGTENNKLYDFGTIKITKSTNLIVWYQ
jgi:hypothetical protein